MIPSLYTHLAAAGDVHGGGGRAQIEAGLLGAEFESVSVVLPAALLHIAHLDGVVAVGRQGAGETGVGVMGEQALAAVDAVVLKGEALAGGIAEFEQGVEWRADAAGVDLGDHALAGATGEAPDIAVAGAVDAREGGATDGQLARGGGGFVGLGFLEVVRLRLRGRFGAGVG